MRLEVLAGLKTKLASDLEKHPGRYRMLPGKFMAVQQAVGCLKANESTAGIDFLKSFVEEAKACGMVQGLIDKHEVAGGLSVAASSEST